jgi:hypothetical protein
MGPHTLPIRSNQLSNELSCLLPGLKWPGKLPSALLEASAFPALCALAGRGRHLPCPARNTLDWLAADGLTTDLPPRYQTPALPWGRLRLAGEDGISEFSASEGKVLCADPIAICFVRDALLVLGPHSLQLSREEADALCAMLNTEFADVGRFHAATPERWYLQTSLASAHFQPLEDVVGRPVAYFPPEGEHAPAWNRLANEIQTALFAHPVNQSRQAEGRPLANAVWFWGEGGQNQDQALTAIPAPKFSWVASADPALRGLASTLGLHGIAPQQPTSGMPGHALWHDARLQQAVLDGNIQAWKEGLEALERELFGPLWQAWQAGRLQCVKLIVPADRDGFDITLGSKLRWAFWRRPLNTESLCSLLQGSR